MNLKTNLLASLWAQMSKIFIPVLVVVVLLAPTDTDLNFAAIQSLLEFAVVTTLVLACVKVFFVAIDFGQETRAQSKSSVRDSVG